MNTLKATQETIAQLREFAREDLAKLEQTPNDHAETQGYLRGCADAYALAASMFSRIEAYLQSEAKEPASAP